MNKKYVALIGILVLAVMVGIGLVMLTNNNSSSATPVQDNKQAYVSHTFSYMQAHYPTNPEVCLATSNDPSLKVDAIDRTDIENSVVGTITDIPAGTNVDVYVKTYDKTNITGSSLYESTYGTYNFIAKKAKANASSQSEEWLVTTFEACKN